MSLLWASASTPEGVLPDGEKAGKGVGREGSGGADSSNAVVSGAGTGRRER